MKKIKSFLSIASLKLGLREKTEDDLIREFLNRKREPIKVNEEWLTEGYKEGTPIERLLYEFATLQKEEQAINQLTRTWRKHFLSPNTKQVLRSRSSDIFSRQQEINESVQALSQFEDLYETN